MSGTSYRTILRSSALIGAAQLVALLAGLARLKAVALLLGPAGLGVMGLYLNLMQTAALMAAMGSEGVGTRQIAAATATGGAAAVARTRRALIIGSLILGTLGGAAFWLSSGWIARHVLSDPARTADLAWLSIGVALSVVAGAQTAVLTGLRRIGWLAALTAAAALASAALGILGLWLFAGRGLVPLLIAPPLVTVLIGLLALHRLGPPQVPNLDLAALSREWRGLIGLGLAFMVSAMVALLGQLAVRTLVQHDLGLAAAGQFQAAWAIGMTYLGFALGAMGTDFYPRLSAVIADRDTATRLVNEQTEVALLLCGPVLVLLIGFAPWVIHLLYTADFAPAVDILRWQLLGDVLKLLSWPLGFVILAAGAGRTFVLTEALAMAVFVAGVHLGLPLLGVSATGVAFLALYLVYLPMVWGLAVRRIGFAWTGAVKAQAVMAGLAALATDLVARLSAPAGATLGTILASALALWAVLRLSQITVASGRFGRLIPLAEQAQSWLNRFR